MTATLQPWNGNRSVHRHNPPESQVSLQQAIRTLRAIRQRYETGRSASSDYVRAYSVQVALGYADMLWITAVIEALEKSVPPSSNEGVELVQRTSPQSSRTTMIAASDTTQPPPAV
jgi:hypothetical protein